VSLALFTDSATSTWAFTTGTIDITSSPAVVTAITGMMPGDKATSPLTIANAGNATFRYAMSTVAAPLSVVPEATMTAPVKRAQPPPASSARTSSVSWLPSASVATVDIA
jgi:hypothetical protein